MTYLLDTDRVIDLLSQTVEAVRLWDLIEADGVAVSAMTCGEVLEGVLLGNDPISAGQVFDQWIGSVHVLPVDLAVAHRFAQIRGELRRAGMLIPDADLLIAATALHHDLTLVTRNRRHFARVPGIRLFPT